MQAKMHTHIRGWSVWIVMGLISALLTGDRGVAAPSYKPEGEMRYCGLRDHLPRLV